MNGQWMRESVDSVLPWRALPRPLLEREGTLQSLRLKLLRPSLCFFFFFRTEKQQTCQPNVVVLDAKNRGSVGFDDCICFVCWNKNIMHILILMLLSARNALEGAPSREVKCC